LRLKLVASAILAAFQIQHSRTAAPGPDQQITASIYFGSCRGQSQLSSDAVAAAVRDPKW